MQPERKLECVLACQSHEVAGIELRECDDSCCSLGQIELKLRVIVISGPRNLDRSPMLGDVPVINKDSDPPDLNILTKEVGVRYLENALVAKFMV